jgi:ABC-2 type transport system ATP-binding protein
MAEIMTWGRMVRVEPTNEGKAATDDSLSKIERAHEQRLQTRLSSQAIDKERPIIRAEDLSFKFRSEFAIRDLTFYVPQAVIFGLVGPSGCGKTTTVRLLNGLYTPDSGELVVLGQTPSHFRSAERRSMGYVAQHVTLQPGLTVQENLDFAASLYGMNPFTRGKRLRAVLEFVELAGVRRRLASQLSGGMQRRLQLACALAHNPQLIFADEPTAGTDPVLRGKFWAHFRQLRDEGHTLFITTQLISEIEYCDLVGLMRDGQLLFVNTPDGLRRRAFGGDVIRIAVTPEKALEAVQLLNNQVNVTDARRSFSQPGLIFVSTNEAATALPTLIAALQQSDIAIRQADEYVVPFDDVFIELMRQADMTEETAREQ